jgi:hypothetical protein
MRLRSRPLRGEPVRNEDFEDGADSLTFDSLHWLTAGLFLAAGTEAGLGERRGDYRAEDAVRWGPLIAAPLAGGAHAARALFPGTATRIAAQVLNGVAVVVGAAGVAGAVYGALRDEPTDRAFHSRTRMPQRLPSFAPLTFAIAGLLGVLLDRDEREAAEEREALLDDLRRTRRRARLIGRLVPERKSRLDRIVLHV